MTESLSKQGLEESMPVVSTVNSKKLFLSILTKVRNVHKRNIFSRDRGAIECLKIIVDNTEGYTLSEFFYTFNSYKQRALNDLRFIEDCRRNGLDPKIVAQHVVFSGDTKFSKVWKDGIESVFGGLIFNMKHPIFDESLLNQNCERQVKGLLPEGSKSSLETLSNPAKVEEFN